VTAAPPGAINESERRRDLARDMIAVHGPEAAHMARENARLAAVAGQAAQARDWLRTLDIIQQLVRA
jgi:hypothetical protein